MEHLRDVLFGLLPAVEYVQFVLCTSGLLKNCPTLHLYFKCLTRKMTCRKLSLRSALDSTPSNVTNLHLFQSCFIDNFAHLTNLVYLRMEDHGSTDLVLPCRLETFIGCNVWGTVTLPETLTSLTLHGDNPNEIIGLDNHPNLTVLHCESIPNFENFEFPPNLVEFQMSVFSIMESLTVYFFPEPLRILRILGVQSDCPMISLPDTLEELNLVSNYVISFRKSPRKLHNLSLPTSNNILGALLSECTNLSKIRLYFVQNSSTRDALKKINQFVPNVTELRFRSGQASTALENLHFDKLKRLTIDTAYNQEKILNLKHL